MALLVREVAHLHPSVSNRCATMLVVVPKDLERVSSGKRSTDYHETFLIYLVFSLGGTKQMRHMTHLN
jgi:hypothetical protein